VLLVDTAAVCLSTHEVNATTYTTQNNKLSYRSTMHALLINLSYVSRAMGVIKVSNSKSDLQDLFKTIGNGAIR